MLWAVPMYRGYLKCRLPDGTQTTSAGDRGGRCDADRCAGANGRGEDGGPPPRSGGVHQCGSGGGRVAAEARASRRGRCAWATASRSTITRPSWRATYRATPEFFWEPVLYTTFSRALTMAPSERRTTSFVLVKVRPGFEIKRSRPPGSAQIPGLKAADQRRILCDDPGLRAEEDGNSDQFRH